MNKLIPVALTAALIGAFTIPQAQQKTYKVGYVSTQALLQAHPQGKAALDIATQRDKDLKDITDKITPLQNKIAAGSATAADRDQYNILAKSYQATAQKYQDRYNKAIQPISNDIDAAIAKAAKAGGYSLLFSKEVGASTGLIVYGDADADLTQEAVKNLKK
ncbi:MAG TPA: OmpH family outer membrane protein [Deinococcales bacterium]|nr:OmpH family outer membrane protein [Deinococcales bacterium]